MKNKTKKLPHVTESQTLLFAAITLILVFIMGYVTWKRSSTPKQVGEFESQIQQIEKQSDSTQVQDIQKDLMNTNLDDIDKEIEQIEKELEVAI